jgi:hypothetical protein
MPIDIREAFVKHPDNQWTADDFASIADDEGAPRCVEDLPPGGATHCPMDLLYQWVSETDDDLDRTTPLGIVLYLLRDACLPSIALEDAWPDLTRAHVVRMVKGRAREWNKRCHPSVNVDMLSFYPDDRALTNKQKFFLSLHREWLEKPKAKKVSVRIPEHLKAKVEELLAAEA